MYVKAKQMGWVTDIQTPKSWQLLVLASQYTECKKPMADKPHYWNRWRIVIAAMLGLIVGQGSINVFAAGVFLKPVAQDLGFGPGEISTAIGLSSVVTAVTTPFFGRLVGLPGARLSLLWLVGLFAVATAALSFLIASTTVLFLLFAIS